MYLVFLLQSTLDSLGVSPFNVQQVVFISLVTILTVIIIKFQQYTLWTIATHNFPQTQLLHKTCLLALLSHDRPATTSYYPLSISNTQNKTPKLTGLASSNYVSLELRHTFIQKLVPRDKIQMLLCDNTVFWLCQNTDQITERNMKYRNKK